MVLEMILSARDGTVQNWWKLFLVGALYATIGLFLAHFVWAEHASLVMVFLTVLAAAHIMHEIIFKEEEYDEEGHDHIDILTHHGEALTVFMVLFMGMMVAYTFWYAVLDWSVVRQVFSEQNATVARIVSGHATSVTGHATVELARFMAIFMNNLGVLVFSFVFGLFYGYGALFILTWNASVIAAAAGSSFRQALARGLAPHERVWEFLASWLTYMPHGIPEILAYFVAALAAGILGAAIARRVWRDQEKSMRVFYDFLEFSILSVIILFLAAIIEVWVTPALI